MLTEKTVVLAKIETLAAYGTDAAPTNTENFIAAHNISVAPNTSWNDTQGQDCSMSPREGTLGRQYMDITFDYELQASLASPLTLPCGPLLQACGFAYDTSGVYTPYTTYPAEASSVTLWAYLDNQLWKSTGARGNVSFTFTAGEPVMLSFTFQGLYGGGFTDSTFPTTCTEFGGKPLVAINQALAWGSDAPEVESLSFSLNNELYARPTMDDARAYGIAGIDITKRNGDGSFNPLATTTADIAFLTAFAAGTATAISYVVGDAVGTVTFSLPKTQLMNISPGDRSGTRIFDFPFRLAQSAGNDEITITCAAAAA